MSLFRSHTKVLRMLASSSREEAGASLFPSPHSLPRGQPFVSLHTLGKNVLTIAVNNKCRVRDVLQVGCKECRIAQERLFGVAVRVPSEGLGSDTPRNEYLFLDPDQYLHKYIGKGSRVPWAANKGDNTKRLVLYLRVVTYVNDIRLITCSRTLENYYIQLRDNLLDQWAGRNSVSEERCWEMAVLALRADKGDNPGGYFRAELYFPLWLIEHRGIDYIKSSMNAANAELGSMSKADAMTLFCQEATRTPYALNTHVYGMRRHKMDTVDRALFTISPSGISVCAVGEGGDRVRLTALEWAKIGRLSFDRRCISIGALDGQSMRLFAQNETKARHLLSLCRSVHQTLLGFNSHLLPRIPEEEKSVDDAVSASTSGVVSDYDKKEVREEIEDEEEEERDEEEEEEEEEAASTSGVSTREEETRAKSFSSLLPLHLQSDSDSLPLPRPSPPPTITAPSSLSSRPSPPSTIAPPPSYPPPTLFPLYLAQQEPGTSAPNSVISYDYEMAPGPSGLPTYQQHQELVNGEGPSGSSTSSVGSRSGSLLDGGAGPRSTVMTGGPPPRGTQSARNTTSVSLYDIGAMHDALSSRRSTSAAYEMTFPSLGYAEMLPPRLSSHSESRIDSLDGVTSSALLPPYPGVHYASSAASYSSHALASRPTTSISRVRSMPAHHHNAVAAPMTSHQHSLYSSAISIPSGLPPYDAAVAARQRDACAEGGRDGPPAFPQPSMLSTSVPSRSPPSSFVEDTRRFPMMQALLAESPSLLETASSSASSSDSLPPDFAPFSLESARGRTYEPHAALSLVPSAQLPAPHLHHRSDFGWVQETAPLILPPPPPYSSAQRQLIS